ncbi:MAG: phosphatidate cytidylyltransferase [Actinobacteria bacterium]|jgi:phosphatidate cytidylyltransferase|nr:phosphatidate cytidylyltransferase [Actinomycetota bacterium]NCZ67761.1 phosphatidate cytidylyltransferase [Acidimicrobiia bacterium]NDD61908.1 phosphatidate cytidylyltransferase [Actinomycetota bacterium]NDF23598.1 phosphatidate cytidylyltransferase [Actinomycetota bacterium]
MSDDRRDDTQPERRDETQSDDTTGRIPDSSLDFGDEFGVVKFADADDSQPAMSVDSTDTAKLPHWSEAPTGESPRFTAEQPVTPPTTPPPVRQPARSGRVRIGVDPTDPRSRPRSDTHPTMRPVTNPTPRDRTNPTVRDRTGGERRASADVSGAERRPVIGDRQPRRPAPVRPEQVRRRRPDRSDSGTQPRPVGRDRNLGSAVIVGAVLAALFIGTSLVGPAAVMALVVVVLGVAALEFFVQVSSRGINAPMIIGVTACIAAPLGAYYMSHLAMAMVVAFAFLAGAIALIGSGEDEHSGALVSLGGLMFGVVYVGLLGAYAAMVLRLSNLSPALPDIGTDTLFIAVLGIAANDIGAYFVGSAIGRTPLRQSISPNKTFEGLIGGTIATFTVVVVIGLQSETWNSLTEWLLLAVVISIFAPIGDLLESVVKRALGIKDFGTVLKGHGGVLDRFDGVLMSLPAVYFLAVTLAPWSS